MSPLPRRWLCLAIATLALAGCESTPAQPDPTVVKLNDVDERLGRIEHVNQGLLQVSQRLDGIEAQMRQLRGELEELQNSNDMLRKQQRDLYADLDRRLSAVQTGAKGAAAGVAGSTNGTAGGAGADSGGDQAAYTRAFDALK